MSVPPKFLMLRSDGSFNTANISVGGIFKENGTDENSNPYWVRQEQMETENPLYLYKSTATGAWQVHTTLGSNDSLPLRSHWSALAPYSPHQRFEYDLNGTMSDDSTIAFNIEQEGLYHFHNISLIIS